MTSIHDPETTAAERRDALGKTDSPVWLVYGLLANRETDHDLRFIARSEKPQRVADEHADTYEAFMAFPEATADQLDAGSRLEIAPVAAAFGLRASFANAAQNAGR